MDVEVRLLDPRLPGWGFPRRGSAGSAGLDLHACLAAPLHLAPGDPPVLVPAGFALAIRDPDWCGLVVPRSGLGHRGLVMGNGTGVIDADYEGPLLVSLWNRNPPGAETFAIEPGDRVAQLVLVRVARPALRFVEAFAPGGDPAVERRGAGGFGSTGRA